MTPVVVALGSNLGDRLARLQAAVESLARHVSLRAASRVYETKPMYVEDQPPYLNAAAAGVTAMAPLELFRALKDTECGLGRAPAERFGPREIDLDLIAYGSARYVFLSHGKEILSVPHPKVAERRFVLQPLFDIAPNSTLPGLGAVAELLAAAEAQRSDVRLLEDAFLSLPGGRP